MLKFYPKKRETLCAKLAFFDYFIDKSLRFFINSKQMIKFHAPPCRRTRCSYELITLPSPAGKGDHLWWMRGTGAHPPTRQSINIRRGRRPRRPDLRRPRRPDLRRPRRPDLRRPQRLLQSVRAKQHGKVSTFVGDGASTSRIDRHAPNNTGGAQMQPAVDDVHTPCDELRKRMN